MHNSIFWALVHVLVLICYKSCERKTMHNSVFCYSSISKCAVIIHKYTQKGTEWNDGLC
jgi:hypothetical protein